MWILHGNVTERGDIGGGPGKSSLFFLTAYHPEIGLSGARVPRPAEPCTFAGSGAPPTILENPREGIVFTPGRTHNRGFSRVVGGATDPAKVRGSAGRETLAPDKPISG